MHILATFQQLLLLFSFNLLLSYVCFRLLCLCIGVTFELKSLCFFLTLPSLLDLFSLSQILHRSNSNLMLLLPLLLRCIPINTGEASLSQFEQIKILNHLSSSRSVLELIYHLINERISIEHFFTPTSFQIIKSGISAASLGFVDARHKLIERNVSK